jgi:protein TonB
MFEDSLMESDHRIKAKSKYWSLASLLVNGVALIALIIWPLLHPEALPTQVMATLIQAPAPPPPPPPPPPLTTVVRVRSEMLSNELQAPSRIPKAITLINESRLPPSLGVQGIEGLTNGSPDGVGVLSSMGIPPPIAVRPIAKKVVISSGVMAGNLLQKTMPQYPAIAKAAGIKGTVILQATISKDGSIQNLRAISGPPMLQRPAIDAVQSWRYKPYLLNGEPVEVETTINVVFNLGG